MVQTGYVWFFLIFALVEFITGFLPLLQIALEKRRFYKRHPNRYYAHKFSFTTRLLLLTLCIFVSVWLMRYVVGYFSSFYQYEGSGLPCDEIGKLGTGFRESVNSLLHALQTFSMDEDYTGYWQNAQFMASTLTGLPENALYPLHLYLAATNVMAPIVGGAIVFEMLTKAFPGIRLFLCNLQPWKPKYYFSELNENSVALARSILSDPKRRRCTLIFTDAYQDDEEEQSTELLLEAKSMGALCLKSDLLHIAFKRHNRGGSYVFLIDKEENANLGILAKMLSPKEMKTYRNAYIYVFSTDRKASSIEGNVVNMINIVKARETPVSPAQNNADKPKKTPDNSAPKLPYILPVNVIRNTADDLMQEVPLFWPLVGTDKKELTVTILGAGSIGTEMFLAAYRFGQMLDIRLKLHVVSQEEEYAEDSGEPGFCNRINYLAPELLRSGREFDRLLQIGCDPEHPDYAQPYMDFTYHRVNVLSDGFIRLLEGDRELLHSDYFIVTLGTDEDNLSAADTLKRLVGREHARSRNKHHTVIACSVYNSDICRKLNEQQTRAYRDSGSGDIYFHAFGCKDEVYSVKNALRPDIMEKAYVIHEKYRNPLYLPSRSQKEKDKEEQEKEYKSFIKDVYGKMSSTAREMHQPYRIFSAGLWDPAVSVFAPPIPDEEWNRLCRSMEKAYRTQWMEAPLSTDEDYAQNSPRLHRMAWLEHRRWNAFMRSCGFCTMTLSEMEHYFHLTAFEHPLKDHKHLGLRLHPCLVEYAQTGIHRKLEANGTVPDGESEGFDSGMTARFDASRLSDGRYDMAKLSGFDRMDLVSYHLRYLKMQEKEAIRCQTEPSLSKEDREALAAAVFIYDFKKYDYPSLESDPNLSAVYRNPSR